ncbi:MAG: hypothetical protein AB8G11_21005 [Saprospiraceae bacterium]
MMKTILKIVCVLMLVVNVANAQKDNSINLTKDNQTKGIEDNYMTTIGQVIEAEKELDLDLAMVYLQIIDNNSNDLYLTATSEDETFDKLPRISEDLIGKTVKASYAKSVEREVVEYRPAQLAEGMANRSVEVDPTITVYTIVGTQKFVSETAEGYEITFTTKSGEEMTFLADEMVFNGHSPIDFDEKEIKISYIEFEDFNLKSLEILD